MPKSVDKIRFENKGWEVTGEPNAIEDQRGVECGDHTIAGGVQVLRSVIYGTNMLWFVNYGYVNVLCEGRKMIITLVSDQWFQLLCLCWLQVYYFYLGNKCR